jgi:hypothetical protein
MISDEEVEDLRQLNKKIRETYPISINDLFTIESIAGFTIFIDKETGPTNENHEDYLLLLNSLHLLVYDVENRVKDKMCDKCKLSQNKG